MEDEDIERDYPATSSEPVPLPLGADDEASVRATDESEVSAVGFEPGDDAGAYVAHPVGAGQNEPMSSPSDGPVEAGGRDEPLDAQTGSADGGAGTPYQGAWTSDGAGGSSTGAPFDPPRLPPPPPAARWARSDDRVVGGVAGGLANGLGLDPLILRLAFVAVGLLSPAGLPAYIGAWLLLRNDPSAAPAGGARKVFGAVLSGFAVIGILASDGPTLGGNVLLAAVLIGVAFAIWGPRRSEQSAGTPAWRAAAEEAQEGLRTAVGEIRDAAGNLTSGGKRSKVEAEWVQRPRVQAVRAPSSPLGRLGFAAAILAGVVTFVVAGRDAEAATWGFGAAAVVCGVALLIGVFWGRARWLIIPGLLAGAGALATGAIAWAEVPFNLRNPIDDSHHPATAENVRPLYRYGAGSLSLDLTNLSEDVATKVEAGVGEIVVVVPESARVILTAKVGFGGVDLPNDDSGEFVTQDVVTSTFGPEGGAKIALDLAVGVGGISVEVGGPTEVVTFDPLPPGPLGMDVPLGAYGRDEFGVYYPGAVVRSDGTIEMDDGTVIYPDGSIESTSPFRRGADGVITFASGVTMQPDGSLRLPNGTPLWRPGDPLAPIDGPVSTTVFSANPTMPTVAPIQPNQAPTVPPSPTTRPTPSTTTTITPEVTT